MRSCVCVNKLFTNAMLLSGHLWLPVQAEELSRWFLVALVVELLTGNRPTFACAS